MFPKLAPEQKTGSPYDIMAQEAKHRKNYENRNGRLGVQGEKKI
jgi:hypothetical protein